MPTRRFGAGLEIKLSALPGGLTVDLRGRKLLTQPFVLQCPPMDEFKLVHQFTVGNYDTILDGQFLRRGGRQLETWQFDTLAMIIGMNVDETRYAPGWVPFNQIGSGGKPQPPEWYVDQLRTVHDAGAPFMLTAQYMLARRNVFHEASPTLRPIIAKPAVLLGFSETHKAGEGDAIYLEGVSFSEWRDPSVSQRGLGGDDGHPSDAPPTSVTMDRFGVVRTNHGQLIPRPKKGSVGGVTRDGHTLPTTPATLADLAKFFYHDPGRWRLIFDANKLRGGSANSPLITFAKYKGHVPKGGVRIKIPALTTLGTGVHGVRAGMAI